MRSSARPRQSYTWTETHQEESHRSPISQLRTFQECVSSVSREDIGVRWVDSLKGRHSEVENLVAQEFSSGSDLDETFAPTPPLKASKFCPRCKSGVICRRLSVVDM